MTHPLLAPAEPLNPRVAGGGVLLLLAASALALEAGTLAMPEGYSWTLNVLSECAGQGVEHAWIARLGFLLFGGAALWLALASRATWGRAAFWMHLAFSAFMAGTAAFSHRPWQPDASFDAFEDLLHSVTATGMGFAFSFGVLACLLQPGRRGRTLDVVALVAAVALPLLGGAVPHSAGLLQRALFVVAYLWYGVEAAGLQRRGSS